LSPGESGHDRPRLGATFEELATFLRSHPEEFEELWPDLVSRTVLLLAEAGHGLLIRETRALARLLREPSLPEGANDRLSSLVDVVSAAYRTTNSTALRARLLDFGDKGVRLLGQLHDSRGVPESAAGEDLATELIDMGLAVRQNQTLYITGFGRSFVRFRNAAAIPVRGAGPKNNFARPSREEIET
jgi:hypothetical protein